MFLILIMNCPQLSLQGTLWLLSKTSQTNPPSYAILPTPLFSKFPQNIPLCSADLSALLKMLSQMWHSNTHSWYQLLGQSIIMEKGVYYIIQFSSHTSHWRNSRQEVNRGIWRNRQLQRPWLCWSAVNCFALHGLQFDFFLHPTPPTQVWHHWKWAVHTHINHL